MSDSLQCPRCGGDCEREMVDVGVGSIPSSDWGCPACFWTPDEVKPYDSERWSWWVSHGVVMFRPATEWQRKAVQANGFKLQSDGIYSQKDSAVVRYAAEAIRMGGFS